MSSPPANTQSMLSSRGQLTTLLLVRGHGRKRKWGEIRPVCWVLGTGPRNNHRFWFLLAGWLSTQDLSPKTKALTGGITHGSRGFSAERCGCSCGEFSWDDVRGGWGTTALLCRALCYFSPVVPWVLPYDILPQARGVRMIHEMASRQ